MKKKQRNQSNKHANLLLVLPVLLICLLTGGLVAYAAKTAVDKTVNTFQIGDVTTQLEESFTSPTSTKPGTAVAKKVAVSNQGTVNQFVRVMVQTEIRIETIGDPGNETILPTIIGKQVTLGSLDTTNWLDGGDGYYYYIKALKPQQTTPTLFEKVTLSTTDSLYLGGEMKMTVKVEAVNCAAFAYRDAWWQGKTSGLTSQQQAIDNKLKVLVEQ